MPRFRYVTRMDLEHYMRVAMGEAERGWRAGDNPFGCVLVSGEGQVLSVAYDRAELDHDPTAHCDLLAIREACAHRGDEVAGATLYTTAEPCPMCFTAAWLAGVSRVVFGAGAAEVQEKAGKYLREMWVPASLVNEWSGDRIELVPGVLGEECLALWDRLLARGGRRLPAAMVIPQSPAIRSAVAM